MTTKLQLIVEDNKIAAQVLKSYCERAGFKVDHAPTVALATKLLLTKCYHTIWMDLGLEDGDGKTLTEWIRAGDNPNQDTPIIVMSAHLDEALKTACLAAGANEALVKPVDHALLDELLRKMGGNR